MFFHLISSRSQKTMHLESMLRCAWRKTHRNSINGSGRHDRGITYLADSGWSRTSQQNPENTTSLYPPNYVSWNHFGDKSGFGTHLLLFLFRSSPSLISKLTYLRPFSFVRYTCSRASSFSQLYVSEHYLRLQHR